MLMQETGIKWSLIPDYDNWYTRINETFERGSTKTKFSYNTHDAVNDKRQWGGTGVFTQGKLKHYVMGAGSDKAKLGRWTWARYRGKGGVVLRVVSIYQPCQNKTGERSVYAQHKHYLQGQNDDTEPREAFRRDLQQELQEWIDEGDQIIIGGDVNECIFHHSLMDIFQELNLRNLIFEHHDATAAPKTYLHSAEGRKIDGIWGTPNIQTIRSGYLEPGQFQSNHSLLWIDVSFADALGHNPPLPQTPVARRLKLSDSKTVQKYLDGYEKEVKKYRLPQRQFALEASTIYGRPLNHAQVQEAEAIDLLRTQCMLRAERKCRKLKMGAIDFSIDLAITLDQLAFWDLALKRKYPPPETAAQRQRRLNCPNPRPRKQISSRLWRRTKKQANITIPTKDLSKEQMQDFYRQAKKKYKSIKKNHKTLRWKFLDTLKPKDRDRLKRVEEQRRMGMIAKSVTGKLASKSVTKIEHEGAEKTTKEDIESVLLDVNYAKCRASDDTIFMTEPKCSEFGLRNETDASQQVLDGTYTPTPDTPPIARKFLANMAISNRIRHLRTKFRPRRRITTADHIRGFKRAKERTSAGMSHLHYGMFKAHVQREHLADLDASMRSVAYATGYSYKRWKKGLDVQLLKRLKCYRADKLRTILLLEADFNNNNKILGADAMYAGEQSKTLARDNYGGRKGLRAVEVSMNQHLTYNSIWGRRGRAIIMSNDAKGCYDRIAHVVLDMAMRRLGCPRPALQSMIETIQEMEHHIRTAFGDSEAHYGNQAHHPPPQGILQGNGAGPAGWSCISAILIETMHKEGYGLKEWSLIRQRAITLTCFAFVDDTDLIHANSDSSVSTEELIQEAQDALQLWEGLLRVSGGALAPEKSYWYLVEVIWKNGKWTYASADDRPGELMLHNAPVDRYEPHQANEALGIQIRPDFKSTDEKQYLKEKIRTWTDAIRTRKLKGYEAWYCLTVTIMKTLEYPLMATSFSREDIDDLMRPLLKVTLPLCGLQRNLPRKLLYGTCESRGLGLKDPFLLQLIAHLQAILRHSNRDTPSHDLLNENMELVQTYIGSDQPFWELPFELYGHLAPDGWIKDTWQALSDTDLCLKGPDITIKAKRKHDVHLMDAFIDRNFSTEQLHILQKCRFFYGADTLADISTACGNRIDPHVWEGSAMPSRLRTNWIQTTRPNPNEWTFWQNALRQTFLHPFSNNRRLRQPLGSWNTSNTTDLDWIWWRHLATDTLYQRTNLHTWTKWTRRPTAGTVAKYHTPAAIDLSDLPQILARTTVSPSVNGITVSVTSSSTNTLPLPAPPPTSLQDTLHTLPDNAKWAIQCLEATDQGQSIATAIQTHQAIAVSDGSLKEGFGTAAFVLEGLTSQHRLRGVNVVPGPVDPGDSHRCEVAGLYGIVTLVHCLTSLHNITDGTITVACDNTHALRIFEETYLPDTNHPNFDLVNATWSLIQNSPILWQGEHVKGHQDDAVLHREYTRMELLNMEMDELAKAYWNHLILQTPLDTTLVPAHHSIHAEGWQLWYNNQKVNRPTTDNLYNLIQTPITQSWWRRHHHVSDQAYSLIDWTCTRETLSALPHYLRQWLTKSASENCGVGTTLVQWKYQDDAKCPRCTCLYETTQHVSVCLGQEANIPWEESMIKLNTFLQNSHTCPRIQTALNDALTKWRSNSPLDWSNHDTDIQQALQAQTVIGWQDFLEALPSQRWQQLQTQYYHSISSQKSSKKWSRDLTTLLVKQGHRQWKHRNDYKHKLGKPRHLLMVQRLEQEIVLEYAKGTSSLLPGDQQKLNINLVDLLHRNLSYKQAWLDNVSQARQRYLRIQQHNNDLIAKSKETSHLIHWMRTGLVR